MDKPEMTWSASVPSMWTLAEQELKTKTSLTLQHHQTILKTQSLELTDCTRGGGVQETMTIILTAFTARLNWRSGTTRT